MISKTQAFQNLANLCESNNFIRRGRAFFRNHGDGVLQVLKVEKIRHWDAYEISLDLFSMYDEELESRSFSAKSCDVRYALVIFCGKQCAEYSEKVGDHYESRIISLDAQVALLEKTVMPFLDNIRTQAQLAAAMCKLDELTYNMTVIWNDLHKYTPFLSSGDYLSAQKVIQSILSQHKSAMESRKETASPQQYEEYCAFIHEQDKLLHQKLQLARSEERAAIETLLKENFERNCKLSRLVKGHKAN